MENSKSPEEAKATEVVTILDRLDTWSKEALKIDGSAALDAAVNAFYDRIVADESLKVYFEGADMEKLRKHQFTFMRSAFSNGKYAYGERPLQKAHERLFKIGLDGNDFDTVAGHLLATLQSLSVPQDIVDDVVAKVVPLRQVFVDGHEAYLKEKEEEESAAGGK